MQKTSNRTTWTCRQLTHSEERRYSMKGGEWRAFRHDTEAGRLLARLYGDTNHGNSSVSGKSKISYPKLHLKAKPSGGITCNQSPLHHAQWRSVGAPHTRDPTEKRYDRAKAASVPVPKFKSKQQTLHAPPCSAVDRIPHRRSQKLCSNEIAKGRANRGAYRPPRQNVIYSEEEKSKLSEINACRGGKILPTDLTHPIAHPSPSEIQKQPSSLDSRHSHTREPTLFDQILDEINERRAWQSEMEAVGCGAESRQKTVDEISMRVKELHRIDKARALEVLKGTVMHG